MMTSGGYHLAWPRDLVETAGGLLAAGAVEDLRRVLDYLRATQELDGHWPQNMWLDGTSLLDRRPDGRDGVPHPSGGPGPPHGGPWRRRNWPNTGRWCARRPPTWSATARSPSRIAGKRTRDTLPSRWPSRSPLCSRRLRWRRAAETGGSPRAICGNRRRLE